MSGRHSTQSHKRLKYFTDKTDFEAPFQFMHELPPVPIEPKLINFSTPIENSINYAPTCLEMNLMGDLTGGLDLDLINPEIYSQALSKEDLAQHKPIEIKEPSHIPTSQSDPTLDILGKLNLKTDEEKSRYKNLNPNEVSMYLRNTTYLTAGGDKSSKRKLDDPIATVTDYKNMEELDGQKLNTLEITSGDPNNMERQGVISKLISRSFQNIKEVKVGMKKGNTQVYAKKVRSVFPRFEVMKKAAYLSHYYDNPLKKIKRPDQGDKADFNNETVLIKKPDEEGYKLYATQDESRGVLGKRKREELDDGVYIKRKVAKYEKIGFYRSTEIDESLQEGAYLFYEIGNDQLAYLPVNKRLSLVKKKETFSKVGGFNLDLDDDPAELEWKDRFFNMAEREYTKKELTKKANNIIKQDAPYALLPDLTSQEQMAAEGIRETYEEEVDFDDKENDEDMKLVLLDNAEDEPQVS